MTKKISANGSNPDTQSGQASETNAALTQRPLIHKRKTLARIVLYGLPIMIAASGYWFIRYADPSLLLALAWKDVDYEQIESVQLFREYLRYDTTYPDGNEIEGAEFLARVLEAEGIDVEIERLGPRNANLQATIEGRDPRRLVLHNHIDTEPIRHPKRWQQDPFGGVLELPFIYGRGAFDMKSITIAQLMAMLDVKRSGKVPGRTLQFLATSDEERDSWLGTRRLLRQHPEWQFEIWAVLTEGGAVEAIGVDSAKYWGTEYHQKRYVDIWVCDSNRRRLAHLRKELKKKRTGWRLEPSIAEFLPFYGPSRDRAITRKLLAEPHKLLDRLRTHKTDVGPTVLTPYVDSMMRSKIAAFPIRKDPEGGFKMRLIVHLLPSLQLDDVWDELIGDALNGFTYRLEETHPPVKASDFNHEAFQEIDRLMKETFPEIDHGPLFIPYSATDARYFRQYGIPTFGFSPFHILSGDAMKMRGIDERMPAPAFVTGAELYSKLVQRLVGL